MRIDRSPLDATTATVSASAVRATSTSDPDARLYRKSSGQKSGLASLVHALMENRNGLAVAAGNRDVQS